MSEEGRLGADSFFIADPPFWTIFEEGEGREAMLGFSGELKLTFTLLVASARISI